MGCCAYFNLVLHAFVSSLKSKETPVNSLRTSNYKAPEQCSLISFCLNLKNVEVHFKDVKDVKKYRCILILLGVLVTALQPGTDTIIMMTLITKRIKLALAYSFTSLVL